MHPPDPAPEGTMDTVRTALTVLAVIGVATFGFYLVCLGIPPDAPPAPKPTIMAVTITCGDVASPVLCGVDLPPIGSNADYGVCRSDGYHTGIDIPVLVGDFVRSMEGGVVVDQGWFSNGMTGYVRVLQIDGLEATYALVVPTVCEGDVLNAGDPVGRAGIFDDDSLDDYSPAILHIGLVYRRLDGTVIPVDPRPLLEYINRCDDELVEPEADTDSGPDASATMP